MFQREWNVLRWAPSALLVAIGLIGIAAVVGDAGGCATFFSGSGDFDSVRLLDRSFFPPSVTCRYVHGEASLTEQQFQWWRYLPVVVLATAALCARFAKTHRRVVPRTPRPLWRHTIGVLGYWTLACATLIGSVFVAFDTAGLGWLGFVGIPVTAWWTMRFLWRLFGGPIAVSSPSI